MRVLEALHLLVERGTFDETISLAIPELRPEFTVAGCVLTGRLEEAQSVDDLDQLYQQFVSYFESGIFTPEQVEAAVQEVVASVYRAGQRQADALVWPSVN